MVAVVIALASCGGKTAPSTAGADSTATTTVTTEVDSLTSALETQVKEKDPTKLQATLTTVQDKYEELVAEGKTEEAKSYASKIKEFVTAHADDLKGVAKNNKTLSSIVDGIGKLPTNISDAAKKVVGGTAAAGEETVDDATKTATETTDAAEDAADKKTNEVKETVKAKAVDAAKNALKNKLGL